MAETPRENVSSAKTIYNELLKRKREGLFCRKCSRYFANRTDFNRHIKEHLKETYGSSSKNFMNYIENYICSKCSKQFEVKSDLIIHYNTVCIEALYICKHCKENCETFPFLQVHLAFYHNYTEEMLRDEGFLTNLENPSFESFSFSTSSTSNEFKTASPEVKKEIDYADCSREVNVISRKSRKSRKKAIKHQNLAFNLLDKAHTCEICNESFSRKCVLEIHVQKHYSPKKKEKKALRKVLKKGLAINVPENNTTIIENHIKTEENTGDPEVKDHTSNIQKATLKPSKLRVHSFWKKVIPKSKFGVKKISAKSATRKSKTRILKVRAQSRCNPKVNSHLPNEDAVSAKWKKIKLKTRIPTVDNFEKQNDSEKSRKPKKPKSSITKQNKEKKNEEKQNKEKKNEEKQIFTCELCKKELKDSYKLRRHFLIHTGLRPFSCTTCKKTFVRDDHLKRHIKRVCSKTAKSE